MIYLSFVWHMHQPCYRNLLSGEHQTSWVRLHATKDYLDMLLILEEFPRIKQVFNLTPVLLEQVEFLNRGEEDLFFRLSRRRPQELSEEERRLIIENFFSSNHQRMISLFPRYLELLGLKDKNHFTERDLLDLQVLFNLSWIDPYFREKDSHLKEIVKKARFFSEEDKNYILNFHKKILSQLIEAYKKFLHKGNIEISTSPFYHPILPLLYSSNVARESNPKVSLPPEVFSSPEDLKAQIHNAREYIESLFDFEIKGFWPSEQAISEHIIPYFIEEGIDWIIADEALLFKSLRRKRRTAHTLYRPYLLKRAKGRLKIIFRDRNLSDLIGFVYHRWEEEKAVEDFISHLKNIDRILHKHQGLVVIALDGENAWEYYRWDGFDFLRCLYKKIEESDFLECTTLKEYLEKFPPQDNIPRVPAGSWVFANFERWIGHPLKNYAWSLLREARELLKKERLGPEIIKKALKQIHILEGSDWFWWEGDEKDGLFDFLFRLHLRNFYHIINKKEPQILDYPLSKTLSQFYGEQKSL